MSHTEARVMPLAVKNRHSKRNTLPLRNKWAMDPLAIDPALLYAKLEVAKLEIDTERMAHDRKRASQHDVARNDSLQEHRTHRHSLRRSLPVESEYTADGKPCLTTAQILAALEKKPERHDSFRKSALDEYLEQNRESSGRGSSDIEALPQPKPRRRFRAEETATKMVAIKHGSQTAYEAVDIDESELIEHADGEVTRPRLSKYDRPHWAQQSQTASELRLLKHSLPGVKTRRARPISDVPAMPAAKLERRASFNAMQGQTSDTLIADAVREIKKEQRLKKLQSVSNLFRRPPCA